MRGAAPPTGNDEQNEQAVVAALDLICSSTEQTCSQFLASFTQLNPETLRSRNTYRDDPRDGQGGDGDTSWRGHEDPSDPPEMTYHLNKVALRVDVKEGDLQGCSLAPGVVAEEGLSAHAPLIIHSTQLDLSSAEKAKHSANLQSREHGTQSTGEPSEEHVIHSTDSAPVEHTTHPACSDMNIQVDWEEMQPFHLDEDFDYDHVVLTQYQTHSQKPKAN